MRGSARWGSARSLAISLICVHLCPSAAHPTPSELPLANLRRATRNRHWSRGRHVRYDEVGAVDRKGDRIMRWQDRIGASPEVCHGKPCIKGTRVLVSVVLADVAAGESFDDIMRGYHI